MSSLRVLVTGANGRIGRVLVPLLGARGHEVVAQVRHSATIYAAARTVCGDLMDRDVLDRAFEALAGDRRQPRTVVHLAAFNGSSGGAPSRPSAFFANVEMAHRVVEGAVTSSVDRVVFASTALVYGTAHAHAHSEDGMPDPASAYAATKLAAEVLVRARTREAGINSDVLRLANLYGPQSPESTMAGMVLARVRRGEPVSLASPDSVRDFLFVRDAAEAMAALLESPPAGAGAIVNIGSGRGISAREFAMAAALVARAPIAVSGASGASKDMLLVDCGMMKSRTGWQARYTLEQGLAECLSSRA